MKNRKNLFQESLTPKTITKFDSISKENISPRRSPRIVEKKRDILLEELTELKRKTEEYEEERQVQNETIRKLKKELLLLKKNKNKFQDQSTEKQTMVSQFGINKDGSEQDLAQLQKNINEISEQLIKTTKELSELQKTYEITSKSLSEYQIKCKAQEKTLSEHTDKVKNL